MATPPPQSGDFLSGPFLGVFKSYSSDRQCLEVWTGEVAVRWGVDGGRPHRGMQCHRVATARRGE